MRWTKIIPVYKYIPCYLPFFPGIYVFTIYPDSPAGYGYGMLYPYHGYCAAGVHTRTCIGSGYGYEKSSGWGTYTVVYVTNTISRAGRITQVISSTASKSAESAYK